MIERLLGTLEGRTHAEECRTGLTPGADAERKRRQQVAADEKGLLS